MGLFSRKKPTPKPEIMEALPPHRGASWDGLWRRFVPDHGQADTVQGELLRATTRVSHESTSNGCCNWGRGFEIFCEFATARLADGTFSAPTSAFVRKTYADMLTLGKWYTKFNALEDEGDDAAAEAMEEKGPPIDEVPREDLYRMEQLAELWCSAHPTPIPRQSDPDLTI